MKYLCSFFLCVPLYLPLQSHPFLHLSSEASLWSLTPWTVLPGCGGRGPSWLPVVISERHCRVVIQNMDSAVSLLDSDFSSALTVCLSVLSYLTWKMRKIILKIMALNITGLSWGGNELIHEKHIDECLAHSTVQMIWVLAFSGIAVISGCSFSVFFADSFSLSVSVCLALAFSPPSLCSSWVTS